MEETIKFFSKMELSHLFRELELERKLARTDYARCCAYRNEAMFKIMYYCALRASEVSILETSFYNNLGNELYCVRLKNGKNNTLEIIDENILRSLKRHIAYNNPGRYLFENKRDNKPLSRKTMDSIIKTCCEKSRIIGKDRWHCHTLRHSRAIHLAEDGFDLKEIQYWLGHSEISSTMTYYQFTAKQQIQLYKKLRKAPAIQALKNCYLQ